MKDARRQRDKGAKQQNNANQINSTFFSILFMEKQDEEFPFFIT